VTNQTTIQLSERERWIFIIVAQAIVPRTFAETRMLNRLWDTLSVDTWDGAKRIQDLGTVPECLACDHAVLKFALEHFEPTLARMSHPLPVPAKTLANEFMDLYERMSQQSRV
jgi:hypothetical protein